MAWTLVCLVFQTLASTGPVCNVLMQNDMTKTCVSFTSSAIKNEFFVFSGTVCTEFWAPSGSNMAEEGTLSSLAQHIVDKNLSTNIGLAAKAKGMCVLRE